MGEEYTANGWGSWRCKSCGEGIDWKGKENAEYVSGDVCAARLSLDYWGDQLVGSWL